jgi:hypothetical protein
MVYERRLTLDELMSRIEQRQEAFKNAMRVNFAPEMERAIAAGIIEDSPALREFLLSVGVEGLRAGLWVAFTDPVD